MRNESLKQLPISKEKYHNKYFMKNTGIDLAKSIGEDFTGKKYVKKENENDVFVFIKDNSIIGVLKGTKKIKDVSSYYEKPVNWKNLKVDAELIIRVPEDQLTYTYKTKKTNRRTSPKEELLKRLEVYKREKYSNISLEKLEKMVLEISNAATLYSLELGENTELDKELKKEIWFYSNKTDALRILPDLIRAIQDIKKEEKDFFGYIEENIKKAKVQVFKISGIFKKYGYIK